MSFNLNENEREMVSTAAFGVCAMHRILRVSHTFEHTFQGGVLHHLSVSFPLYQSLRTRDKSEWQDLSDSYRVI